MFVKDNGLILPASSVTPIVKALAVDLLDSNSGSANGGYEVTISGQGFPLDKKDIQSLTVCGQSATVKSITNIETTIIMPACSSVNETIAYQYNDETQTIAFTYTSTTTQAQITSISPVSASPVLKGVMTIVGSGFTDDKTKVKVHLSNATGKIYEMRIL